MKKTKRSTKTPKKKKKSVKRATSVIKKKKSYYVPVALRVKKDVPVVAQPVAEVKVPEVVDPKKAGKRPTSTKTTGNYLSKKELMKAVMESKGLGRMSNDLANKLMLLVSKYAKHPWFARYTYNTDMQAYALMMLVGTWNSFNPEKSDNPFAFYTQCIKNSFQQYKLKEKRQRNIVDELLVDRGLTPSYSYQAEYDSEMRHQVEQEQEVAQQLREDTQHEMDESSATE